MAGVAEGLGDPTTHVQVLFIGSPQILGVTRFAPSRLSAFCFCGVCALFGSCIVGSLATYWSSMSSSVSDPLLMFCSCGLSLLRFVFPVSSFLLLLWSNTVFGFIRKNILTREMYVTGSLNNKMGTVVVNLDGLFGDRAKYEKEEEHPSKEEILFQKMELKN